MRRVACADGAGMAGSRAEFASQLVDSLSSGVVGIDACATVQLFNGGARRLLAGALGAPEQVLGRPVSEVLATQPQLVTLLISALDGRSPVSRAEISLAGPTGPYTAGFTLNAVRDAQGAVTGSVLLLRDLTPFEQSDERQRLQERLAALGQMAAGMAHEIRNPLAGMEVIAGLLRRRLSGEDHELAAELSEQIRSVADIVSASLDFVRPVEPRRDLLDVVGLVEASLRRGVARSSIPLTVERDIASPLPLVRGDEPLLVTALANLVANACEVMSAGDQQQGAHLVIRVRAQRALHSAPWEQLSSHPSEPALRRLCAAPEVVISVEDSGPGIAESDRERVFYPFYTTKQNGSGIGLAQAQKISMAHGGCITVDGGAGRGAVFHVHLPAVTA